MVVVLVGILNCIYWLLLAHLEHVERQCSLAGISIVGLGLHVVIGINLVCAVSGRHEFDVHLILKSFICQICLV